MNKYKMARYYNIIVINVAPKNKNNDDKKKNTSRDNVNKYKRKNNNNDWRQNAKVSNDNRG